MYISTNGFVARLLRQVQLEEQELLILPELLSSPPVFSGVHVTRSLVLCVCFVDRCLSFCSFSFDHCVVCASSIYGFLYPFGIFKLFWQLKCISEDKWIFNWYPHNIFGFRIISFLLFIFHCDLIPCRSLSFFSEISLIFFVPSSDTVVCLCRFDLNFVNTFLRRRHVEMNRYN